MIYHEDYDSVPKVLTKDWADENIPRNATHIDIPDGVKALGDFCLRYRTSLKSVNIPEGVTEIGDSGFYGCESLRSITIPRSMKYIGEECFYDCDTRGGQIEDVYYAGSKEEKGNIEVDRGNVMFTKCATWHCSDGVIEGRKYNWKDEYEDRTGEKYEDNSHDVYLKCGDYAGYIDANEIVEDLADASGEDYDYVETHFDELVDEYYGDLVDEYQATAPEWGDYVGEDDEDDDDEDGL